MGPGAWVQMGLGPLASQVYGDSVRYLGGNKKIRGLVIRKHLGFGQAVLKLQALGLLQPNVTLPLVGVGAEYLLCDGGSRCRLVDDFEAFTGVSPRSL